MPQKKFDPTLVRAAVYGANDGIITTFAVVAGVAGAGLSAQVVLILGIANMIADGLSMGLGDFLGEKSERRMRRQHGEKIQGPAVWHTGLVTFIAFVFAGVLPLLPYVLEFVGVHILFDQFVVSALATAVTLFVVGSLRTLMTRGSWIHNGLEMLSVGAIAAVVAYLLGAWVESVVR